MKRTCEIKAVILHRLSNKAVFYVERQKQRKKERKEKRKPPAAIEIMRVAKAASACMKGGGRQQCLTQ